MKHIVVASILVLIVTALVILGLGSLDLIPNLASAEGQLVDQMFTLQIYVISFVFSLIVVFVLYGALVFRRKPGDETDGRFVKGNAPLEIAWTLIPLAVVIGFGILGARDLGKITATTQEDLIVEVTGFQFGWQFDYPDYQVSTSELYLPRDRPVLFKITSKDVIHSFWVPEFRVKQDAVPGRWTSLRVTPTENGDYRVRCAELCGYAHSAMYAPVAVVDPADFEAWLSGQAVPPQAGGEMSPAEQGATLAKNSGCLGCHSIDGSKVIGPTWLGLYGSQRTLEGGSTVVADEQYLRNSILDPESQIVAGYPKVMPSAYTTLSEDDLSTIVEYIKSLGQ
jgi:cytochrome c oxidase subunit II